MPCPIEEWQSLCDSDPTCTFYQTPAWLEITAEYLRQTPNATDPSYASTEVAAWKFSFPQGSVVLPLLRRRRLAAWHYFSPFGTYTAPISAQALGYQERQQMVRALSQVNLLLTSSPFSPNAVQVGKPLDFAIQVVDLTRLDPAHPMRDWEEGQQRRVRVSQRSGVTLRKAESDADWNRYYALYESSLARWGENATTVYQANLFAALRKRLQGKPQMSLWLAEVPSQALREALSEPSAETANFIAPLEDKPVIAAGYLTFYHQGHVVPWHGAGDKSLFRFGVTQALFHRMMSDAATAGYRYFDLTGSSGLSGVAAFKSRFGTQAMAFQGSLNQVGWYGLLSRGKQFLKGLRPSEAA